MSAVTITILSDTATPAIERLRAIATGPALKMAAGRALATVVKKHIRTLPPNKNFPEASTGFWKDTYASVTSPVITRKGVTVSITQPGFRQQLLGGTITPTNAKMLTIPARSEAYGKRASEFNLKLEEFGVGPTGRPTLALVNADIPMSKYRTTKDGKRIAVGPVTSGEVMYWLTPSVTQEPHPEILPTEQEMQEAVAKGMRSYIQVSLHDRNARVELTGDGDAP
jgi:hypothetical protein